MVKRGPHLRPQASEGEAQHGLFCWTGCVGQGDERLHWLAKPMNGINAPQRPDCVADDAVSCELVSAANSLLTGKLTGNFAESGPLLRFRRPINELIQRIAAKFPTQRNREFLQP